MGQWWKDTDRGNPHKLVPLPLCYTSHVVWLWTNRVLIRGMWEAGDWPSGSRRIRLWNLSGRNQIVISHQVQVKVKSALEQATKAQRSSRCVTLVFFNLSDRCGWVVNATPRQLYPRERAGTQEAGWAPGPVWTGAENFVPIGIRSPNRPAHSSHHVNRIWIW
jgi:hypothetical protein